MSPPASLAALVISALGDDVRAIVFSSLAIRGIPLVPLPSRPISCAAAPFSGLRSKLISRSADLCWWIRYVAMAFMWRYMLGLPAIVFSPNFCVT